MECGRRVRQKGVGHILQLRFFLPRVTMGRCYRTEEKHDGENVLKKKEWVKCSHAVALIVRRSAPNTEL